MLSLFKIGLGLMFFFVLASNVLNYVSIGTDQWASDGTSTSLWYPCTYIQNQPRSLCFLTNPPALMATGTAFNCLSFLLILVSLLSMCLPRFKNSFALYFVIGSFLTTLLSLVLNSTGWYFVFFPQYQNLGSSSGKNAFNLGWSFWLMAGSMGCSVLASLIGASIFGCTCVTNKIARQGVQSNKIVSNQQSRNSSYTSRDVELQIADKVSHHDSQVLRLWKK